MRTVDCITFYGKWKVPNQEKTNRSRSDEGLTLETSAFQIFHGGNSTFIISFDKTKFPLFLVFCRDGKSRYITITPLELQAG